MLVRVLSALFLIPIGVFFVFFEPFNGIGFSVVMFLIMIGMSYEISRMALNKGLKNFIWINSIFTTLSAVCFFLYAFRVPYMNITRFFLIEILLLTLVTCISLFRASFAENFDKSFEQAGLPIISYIITGVLFPFSILLQVEDPSGWRVFIIALIVWMSDGGGYFAGSLFGKTKIKNFSSPKKSIEGYIGVLVFGLLSGGIILIIQNIFQVTTSFSVIEIIIISIILTILGSVGDICESTMKRWAGVKDSGTLVPGHGGVYDRFDSMVFTLPVYYITLKLFGY